MKPYIKLAETTMPDGTVFSLHKHDNHFYLKNDLLDLMSTKLTSSEQLLAEKGLAHLTTSRDIGPEGPKVLIGGLGMGFTLKRALELLEKPAMVKVAELVADIVDWNRTHLVEHNGPLLEDERTYIFHGDLFDCLNQDQETKYDAILIDIDDAPDQLITEVNSRLYTPEFLARIKSAIAPGGRVSYWLAEPTPFFEKSLIKAGFKVEAIPAKPHELSKRPRHCIYVAEPTS